MKEVALKIAAITLGVLAIALIVIEQGWAISTLWGWFITPLGAPSIGIAAGIGVAVTVSAIRHKYTKTESDDKYQVIVYSLMQPVVCVAVGWIAKQYV